MLPWLVSWFKHPAHSYLYASLISVLIQAPCPFLSVCRPWLVYWFKHPVHSQLYADMIQAPCSFTTVRCPDSSTLFIHNCTLPWLVHWFKHPVHSHAVLMSALIQTPCGTHDVQSWVLRLVYMVQIDLPVEPTVCSLVLRSQICNQNYRWKPRGLVSCIVMFRCAAQFYWIMLAPQELNALYAWNSPRRGAYLRSSTTIIFI